jgi:hypothetical protein
MYYRTEIFIVAVIDFFLTYINEKLLISLLNRFLQNRAERKRLTSIEENIQKAINKNEERFLKQQKELNDTNE